MSIVTCSNCKSKNTEGSKFCNNCGAALPLSSHITCPNCETRNPRNLMYCDNCGTRLLPTGELSSEKEEEKAPKPPSREAPKAFSLPVREPGDELDQNQLFDWLRTGEEQGEGEGEQEAALGAAENVQETSASQEGVLGDWLGELSDIESDDGPADEGGLGDWLAELEDMDEAPSSESGFDQLEGDSADIEDTLPNWLDELAIEDSSTADLQEESDEETFADWFSDFEVDEDETAEQWSDLPTTDILTPSDPTPDDFEKTLMAPSPFQEDDADVADWLSEFGDESETSDDEDEDELPDWLNDFNAETETPTLIGSTEPTEEEEELPDWLSDFNSEDTPTLIESAVPSASEEEELPDWITDFNVEDDSSDSAESAVSEEADGEELPDWLSEVSSEDDVTTDADSAVSEEADGEELPDWLSDFGEVAETPTLVGSSLPADDDEEALPDWLSGFDEDTDETPTQVGSSLASDDDEALPEWLSEFGEAEDEEAPTLIEPAFSSEEAEELPDWLGGFDEDDEAAADVETAAGPDAEADLEDWLTDLDSDDETPTLVGSALPTDEAEELSDWLADFDDDDDTPTLISSAEPSVGEEDLPDWLSEFDSAEQAPEAADSLPETAEDEILPDWLSDLSGDDETAMDSDTFEAVDDTGGLPDWFSDIPSEDTDQSFDSDEAAEDIDDIFADFNTAEMSPVEELPDWLSEVGPEVEEEPPVEIEALGSEEDDGLPDWLADFPDETGTLDLDEADWFEALTQDEAWPEAVEDEELVSRLEESEKETADPTTPSKELKGVPKELVSSDLPDWLQEDMPESSSFDDDPDNLPEGELPEWLKQMRPSELSSSGEELGLGEGMPLSETQDEWQTIFENMPSADRGIGPSNAGLSEAEIPAWLQALKPRSIGEEPDIDMSDEEPETEGPLAGLRGVLQVAPYIAEPAASTSPTRFTISKEQQQQISLLHRLTHEEQAATKQVSQKKAATFSAMGRGLLGLLLLITVIAGILLPKTDIPLPETALRVQQGALDTYNTLDGLVGRSVLVAFDYTPAMAAELDPMALMLLRQLAANGNRVLTISQSAAGTTIANQLVSEVNDLDSQSLGLLTGEAVGLRSLGSCLDTTDSCELLFGASADPALQAELADLGSIIIITSDRNSLINWIEQVESQTDAPMITAVIQPLGPLTIPYLSSDQLEGSLNGIPDASAYEKRLLGQDGGTFEQFTAQSIVMWVVIVALIVAGLFYGLAGFAGRDEKKGNG